MNLTSEQVHWIFGAALIVTAVLLLLRARAILKGGWTDYIVPSALAVFGIEFALDPLVHGEAAPQNYAAEMYQHFIVSAALIVASGAEFLRLARAGRSFLWRLPLVTALAVAAGIFMLHAQHDAPAGMLLLMTQHRMIGSTLAVAALAALLDAVPATEQDEFRSTALPLLILVLGVQLLFYTEGSNLFGGASH